MIWWIGSGGKLRLGAQNQVRTTCRWRRGPNEDRARHYATVTSIALSRYYRRQIAGTEPVAAAAGTLAAAAAASEYISQNSPIAAAAAAAVAYLDAR